MDSNDSPQSEVPITGSKIAEALIQLSRDFVSVVTQVTFDGLNSIPLVDFNANRVFVGFYSKQTNTAQIGLENPQTNFTGMSLGQNSTDTREYYVERDKRLTTSAWFGFCSVAGMTVNIYQVIFRGKE